MPPKSSANPTEKQNLHPRNPHRLQYDFKTLIKGTRELGAFVSINKYNNESIDFTNPEAVKILNKALLKHFYKINHWDIPPHYLCPPIPGRADYIHYLADLLAGDGNIPTGRQVRGLDIGMGANCVYPILGHQSYGWNFAGSDVDSTAVEAARKIVNLNPELTPFIECRLQTLPSNIFNGVVQPGEKFDFTMCNPPFHASLAEAVDASQRKWRNLGHKQSYQKKALNFGGQHAELWCPGGEQAFITRMIEQSVPLAKQCLWFTALISKKTTLPNLYQSLNKVGALEVKTIGMSQGQKVSRMLAWTFIEPKMQKSWKSERWLQ